LQKVIIASRGSQLALWQSNWVRSNLERLNPGLGVEIKIIKTKGDLILDQALPELGAAGKGLFTRELEEEMLDGRADLAVHSLKDLPTDLPEGLGIGAISEREDVRDALVAREGIMSFAELPYGAVVGTSSLRRQSQMLSVRPDIKVVPIRGNVDTRLRKLDEKQFDAIVLAAAGLHRLDRGHRITQYLSESFLLPAVGQGALGIETRSQDERINNMVKRIDHAPTRFACEAERAFLTGLGGGCLVPIAALARASEGEVTINGLVAKADGSEVIRGKETGAARSASEIGGRLAEKLLGQGAKALLEAH